MNNSGPSSARGTPDPAQRQGAGSMSPSHALRPINTTVTQEQPICPADRGKPSPYARKETARSQDDADMVNSGIGGPPKRRESMSGIGNNLRSHQHAGLGRAVGRSPPKSKAPPGLTNRLRRASAQDGACQQSPGLPAVQISDEIQHSVQRRGSSGTSSTVTADASAFTAGQTVFPTNPDFTFGSSRPQRRRTVASAHYLSPGAAGAHSVRNRHPQNTRSPTPLAHAQTMPTGGLMTLRGSCSQALDIPSDANALRRAGTCTLYAGSPCSPVSPSSIRMTIGSPNAGEIVDVVGSYSRPSVVYAPVHRQSHIGGSAAGKAEMQTKSGLGGKYGKDWMADRPSNLGAPAPRNEHPESGLKKLFKAFHIGTKSASSSKCDVVECDDEDELASDVEWLSDSTLEELVLSDSSVLSSVDVSSVVSEKVSLLVSPLVEVISVNDSAEEMSGLLSIVTDSIGAVDISNEVLGGSDDKPITVNVMASESVNVSESSASVGAVLEGIKIPSSIKLIEGSTQ
ncbi:hypothetical protein LPJ78_000325 [Coemansia sp. RSA 989]|nr:hypothetical protein LPJ78_000325 [Coemansia sp. RSA 989]KAJ2677378.1 hypothetical protein IWW42_000185 [Coemansia sp. RSA 1085]